MPNNNADWALWVTAVLGAFGAATALLTLYVNWRTARTKALQDGAASVDKQEEALRSDLFTQWQNAKQERDDLKKQNQLLAEQNAELRRQNALQAQEIDELKADREHVRRMTEAQQAEAAAKIDDLTGKVKSLTDLIEAKWGKQGK